MLVQDEDGTEFLDLKLKLENSKIAVFLLRPPTVSHMSFLLVVTLKKISIIYHMV